MAGHASGTSFIDELHLTGHLVMACSFVPRDGDYWSTWLSASDDNDEDQLRYAVDNWRMRPSNGEVGVVWVWPHATFPVRRWRLVMEKTRTKGNFHFPGQWETRRS